MRYKADINTNKKRIEFIHEKSGDAFYISFDFIRQNTDEQITRILNDRFDIQDRDALALTSSS